jgi:hypothetical protein
MRETAIHGNSLRVKIVGKFSASSTRQISDFILTDCIFARFPDVNDIANAIALAYKSYKSSRRLLECLRKRKLIDADKYLSKDRDGINSSGTRQRAFRANLARMRNGEERH